MIRGSRIRGKPQANLACHDMCSLDWRHSEFWLVWRMMATSPTREAVNILTLSNHIHTPQGKLTMYPLRLVASFTWYDVRDKFDLSAVSHV